MKRPLFGPNVMRLLTRPMVIPRPKLSTRLEPMPPLVPNPWTDGEMRYARRMDRHERALTERRRKCNA